MGELEDKISALLSSPDGMTQIMSIVRSLAGDTPSDQASSSAHGAAESVTGSGGESPFGSSGPDAAPASGPEIPAQLTAESFSRIQNIDPRFMSMIMRILGEFSSGNDKNILLLQSLKPYLKSERHQKIDKATQIVRLTKTIRTVFEALNGGDGFV